MMDRFDILNGAEVAAKAGTRKSLGSRKVGLALRAQRGNLVAEGVVAEPAGLPSVQADCAFPPARLPRRCAPRNDRVGTRSNDRVGTRKGLVVRNRDLRGQPAGGGGGGVPGISFDFRSTYPDGSLEAARGEIAPEIRNPRVGVTKKVAGLPERAKIRRTMEEGSSVG